MRIEIMDTTLRDGEQTSGVAFTEMEKLNIAKMLLEEVKVDRVEIASARVSPGEYNATKRIVQWAESNNYLSKVEILGFIDGTRSVDWVRDAGGKVINLLCKGSRKHVVTQLRKTPEEHLNDIRQLLAYAQQSGIGANIYLEDWSNGMKDSPDYVCFLLDSLKQEPIMRIMLPDTLGILNPDETYSYCHMMLEKYPQLRFDFHGHNDYDLAVANSLAAVRAGISGVHTTVNGLGERAGNTPLASIVAVLHDHLEGVLSVNENMLNKISRVVESFAGIRVSPNKPVVGDHVFTQTCGVHADGDSKGNLYYNRLMPERFGRIRKYALGKTSGKASIKKNLEDLGIELDPQTMDKVARRVVELGDKKENITTEDLPYIISDVLGSDIKEKIKIHNYYICNVHNLKPVATLSVDIDGQVFEATSTGDGQYDAFMKALNKIYESIRKPLPSLVDYMVTIPPGGKTDALVETMITWEMEEREFKTRGLDSDQTTAAIKATIKMLNLIEPNLN